MSGVKTWIVGGALVLVTGGIVLAQQAGPEAGKARQIQARFQILAMEGVLERAVQLGAQRMRADVQTVAPDMLFISGAARARGFWLEGYGVFFDVDVPAMRRSVAWSFRMLEQTDRGIETAIASLKRQIEAVDDPAARREMQQTVQQLEARVGPGPVAAAATAGGGFRSAARATTTPGPPAAREIGPEAAAILDDPGAAYTTQVKDALVDAMIEYSAPLSLRADEWLTIAARDQDGSRLQPGDPYEVSTILLRIRGSELTAFRAGQLNRDETRRRVEVKEY